jgi:hypothetical protein
VKNNNAGEGEGGEREREKEIVINLPVSKELMKPNYQVLFLV